MPTWLIALLVIGAPIGLYIVLFNALVADRAQAQNGWAQIDVQLKRRSDLIPNLVESVKGALHHEHETLAEVTRWRNQAAALQGTGDLGARVQAEGQLSGALGRLFAVMEAYPQLKAMENIASLQEELVSTENRIGFARQHYNDVTTTYNMRLQQIPTNVIASFAAMKPMPLFEIQEAERAAPKVQLTS